MSKPMKIAEALARIAKNRADEDALAVARQQIGTRAVIMLKAGTDDLLDPKETLDAMQHAAMLRVERIPGGITLEAWLAAARQDAEACPITGRPLYKGRVEVPRPGGLPPRVVDWSPVPAELRLVAAYRAELGVAVPPDLAVASLTASQLPVEWERARQDWEELRDLKRLTPEQRQLVERVRARLVYTPESEHPTPQHAGPVLAMGVPREPCAADGQIGCPGDRGTYTRDGEIPGAAQAAPGAPLVVGLYARADVRFWQDLRTHASPLQRQGLAQFWGCSEVPAGMPVRTYLTEQVARAAVVVVLVSADFLADAELNDLALIAMGRRKNVWPIVVRPCLLDLSPLAKLSGVQLNQGATMLDVAQQLRQRLK